MKRIRRAIRSSLKSKSKKTSKSTAEVVKSKPSTTATIKPTSDIRINSKFDAKPIVIPVTTPYRRSYADTFNASSNFATDCSPVPTVSSRTSVAESSGNANQRYQEEIAALGLAIKLPLPELSLIASDSNFVLGSGEAVKEADFCGLQSTLSTEVDSDLPGYWKKEEFDIFEEKRGPGHSIPSCVESTSAFDAPPSISSSIIISEPTPETTSSTKAPPGHPACLTDAEFEALPLYEDIEDDPTYESIWWKRFNDSSASSNASIRSEVPPGKVKMGFDIGGILYFFQRGTKRKTPRQSKDKVSNRRAKKQDCRVREKQVRSRFGIPMSTDEDDFGSDDEFEEEEFHEARDEAGYATDRSSSSYSSTALLDMLNRCSIALQGKKGTRPVDDGFGGHGREIF